MRARLAGRRARRVARGLALAASAAVVGAGAVGVAALVAGDLPGEAWQVAPVLGGATAAALTWPVVRRRAVAFTDQAVLGVRRDPGEVLRTFEAASRRDVALVDLLVPLAESLVRTFAAGTAQVWLLEDHRLHRSVAVPDRGPRRIDLEAGTERALGSSGVVGRAWADLWLPALAVDELGELGELRLVPATHAGAVLGLVVLGRVPGAAPFEPTEDAALADLGPRVGVVLHNRRLDAALQATLEDLRRTNDDLRASRVRLVSAADAERRRIERDLHDGAQQHLVALAVNLRLADDAIAEDPGVASEVLGALGDDLRAAIAELRSLAHGIFPPLLMDAGVVEALRVVADRSPSPVLLTATAVDRYAAEVESAVYFCCLEALQNAGKHAPGAPVRVHLEEVDGAIAFRVDDDGPGPGDARIVPGHGLANMTDRVGALGGTLQVEVSPSGGTLVAGSIPLRGELS